MKKSFLVEWNSGCFRTGSSGLLGGISGGRKFRPTGGSSGPSAISTKSSLGSLSGGVPELSPGSSPRKFPVVRKFRPSGRKFRPEEISGGKTTKSYLGSLSGGVPVLSSGKFPRKFPAGRKFRPPGRKFRPVEISRGNMAKSFLGTLSGGVPEL